MSEDWRGGEGGRRRRIAGRAGFGLAVLAAVALGTVVLHGRVEPEADRRAAPLAVAAETVRLVPGYAETRRFVGRVEPYRETALGFERPGRIVEVMVEEGDPVAEGAVVARLDTALLEVARQRLEALRAQQAAAAELARLTFERQRGLSDLATSAQRLDEARLGLAVAEAALRATEAELAAVAVDRAKSVLRAPYAATVAGRALHEGAVVEPGRPVVTLVEAGRPRLRAGLAPDVAARLSPGARMKVETGGGEAWARLMALRPDLDTGSRTVTALLELELETETGTETETAAAAVPFGEIATVLIDVPHAVPGFWVALGALTEGARGTWTVYALREEARDLRVAREAVELVAVAGERAFVRGPLRDGDRIVSTGTHRIRDGQDVVLAAAE